MTKRYMYIGKRYNVLQSMHSEAKDYEVVVVTTLKTAQTLIKKRRFDAIFTELVVDGDYLGGYKILHFIKTFDKNNRTPVYAIGHYELKESREWILGLGFTEYCHIPKDEEVNKCILVKKDKQKRNSAA
ncbi:hypothetical protein [Croceiramulus getboli]|nr:hypothetical protein P8624_10640 [Flavobacteriaceae bacterium YJPT1-3]